MATVKSIFTHCAGFLWRWAKEEICPSKSGTLDELEQQREIIFPLFLLIAPGTVLIVCLPGCRN
jgi:hypothetical protein